MNDHLSSLYWYDEFSKIPDKYVGATKAINLENSLSHWDKKDISLNSFPSKYIIEPTNLCNLACSLCPTKYKDSPMPKGYMVDELFSAILEQIKD